MHVIVSPVFPPEPVVSSQTSAQIADALARSGNNVTVITTFPNRPGGRLYPGYRRKIWEWSTLQNGVRVLRCFSFISRRSTRLSRLAENISFGLFSSVAFALIRRPTVLYSNSWPLFATSVLVFMARLRGVPVVTSIQDVYPESLFAQGRVDSHSWLLRSLRRLDRWVAHRSHHLIVISESFRQIYVSDRGVSSERISVIPNWGEPSPVDPTQGSGKDWRRRWNMASNDFVLMFGGNVGIAANVEALVRAVLEMPEKPLRLVIAGDGSQLPACMQIAAGSAGRVIFHTPWKPEETAPILQAADVLVLPTRGTQSLASVPSKLVTYFFCERPVLAIVKGESDIAIHIRNAACGWIVDPDSPHELRDTIIAIQQLPPAKLASMGKNAGAYARKHFSRDISLPRIMEVVKSAARLSQYSALDEVLS